MNTDNTQTMVETKVEKRGRKRNPALLRTIYLNADNTPRTKGAPKVGSSIKAVDVQYSVKNSEFNYQTTPFTNERMEVVGPRQPRTKKVVVISNVQPATVEAIAPVAEVAPVAMEVASAEVEPAAYTVPN